MENEFNKEFFQRKEKFVHKEFDTAFTRYQGLDGKISSIRQWTITINVGLVLFVLSENHRLSILFVMVLIFMIILLLHELRVRSSMAFDKKNILELEKMFNESDIKKYQEMILNYEFRDQKIPTIGIWGKLRDYIKSFFKGEVIAWYFMWTAIWMFLFICFRYFWIKNNVTLFCNISYVIGSFWLIVFIVYFFQGTFRKLLLRICKLFTKNSPEKTTK